MCFICRIEDFCRRIRRRRRERRVRRDSDNCNNGRNRRRRWFWQRSRPSNYQRPNPGWPPNYDSDTPQTYNISNREDPPPQSGGRTEAHMPPPPYLDPPPPYSSDEQATISASTTVPERKRIGEPVEIKYGDPIYEFLYSSPSELATTSASSSELDRRDRHPTSVYAGVLRKKR
ncbi:unnamed protein product [Rodentolepis nana]|uniref:Similar to n=1 Tax=Rodentolepis nana TaxID=102285 RepID=A0A0R3TGH7_RODNA|nr:unnamed protein product [Rodentolepis nana]